MNKKKVIFIKTNLLDIDPRLHKEMEALKRDGYSITLVCWERESRIKNVEPADYDEIRLRFKAPIGTKIIFFLPVWWCFVIFKLMLVDWDIVHAINFDSLIPSLIVSKLKKRPIIYEIFDVYADIRILPPPMRWIGINIEKLFMHLANIVIIANEAQPVELNGIPNKNVIGIYNSPPDVFTGFNKIKQDKFILFFAGSLQSDRHTNIDKVYKAILEMDDVKLILAGYGDKAKEFQVLSISNPNKLEFLGIISYSEVLRRTLSCDLIFALYDPRVPGIRYACGNKLFEAMMAGKPYLVSKGTEMAKVVVQEECGLTVDCNSIPDIKAAINKLKENSELCKILGSNGRKAYERKYNWKIMEDRLLKAYESL